MRTIYIALTCLGLFLVALSLQEIAQIQRYRALVAQVKTTVTRLYSDERLTHRSYVTSPSMESVLSELDTAIELERSWRIVRWTGAAVGIAGLAGLLCNEWLRRRRSAENPPELPLPRLKVGL